MSGHRPRRRKSTLVLAACAALFVFGLGLRPPIPFTLVIAAGVAAWFVLGAARARVDIARHHAPIATTPPRSCVVIRRLGEPANRAER